MKKIKILIPNLITLTTIPLISLVGCNKGGNQPIETKFSVASTEMKSGQDNYDCADLELDWADGHSIKFDKTQFHFFYDNGTYELSDSNIEVKGADYDRPFRIRLHFDEEHQAKNKITDGVLKFTYTDDTIAATKNGEVKNIKITIPWAVEFNDIDTSEMGSIKAAAINLKWTPSELQPTSTLEFENLDFKYNSDEEGVDEVSLGVSSTSNQILNLKFTNNVFNNITDGVLTFDYTIGDHKTLYSYEIKKIKINIPDPQEFGFSIETNGMTDEENATIVLKWSLEKSLEFDEQELKFEYGSGTPRKTATVTPTGTQTTTSQSFNLKFDEKITAQDITDGTFKFTYIPDKDKGFKYEDSIDSIHINKLTFEQDTWEHICEHASSLGNLKAHYGLGTNDSFVGTIKEITIDGFTYELQVIGENEDYIADADGKPTNTPAALTFMFKTVIQKKNASGDYEPYLMNFAKSSIDAFEEDFWQNSAPKEYLNSSIGFLPKLEEALGAPGIVKTISKNTISDFIDGTVAHAGEKLFLPSLADIFSSGEHFQLPPINDSSEEINEEAYIQEGRKIQSGEENHYARYSYFNTIIDDETTFADQHQELAVYDGHGEGLLHEVSYWLRSCYPKYIAPYQEDHQEWLWCSSNTGISELDWKVAPIQTWKELENEPDPDYMAGLAPIFCI